MTKREVETLLWICFIAILGWCVVSFARAQVVGPTPTAIMVRLSDGTTGEVPVTTLIPPPTRQNVRPLPRNANGSYYIPSPTATNIIIFRNGILQRDCLVCDYVHGLPSATSVQIKPNVTAPWMVNDSVTAVYTTPGSEPLPPPQVVVVPPPPIFVSLFDTTLLPVILGGDPSPISAGVKFSSDVNGTVTALKFYKVASNVGEHIGTLWAADGTQLATGSFTNETSDGWQTLTLATPVAITAHTSYVASYFSVGGNYAATAATFEQQYDHAPLHVSSGGGLYSYGDAPALPLTTSNTNYWVDVVFKY